MSTLKKGDRVRVLSGSQKGAEGAVLVVFPDTNSVIVEGVNIKKRHIKGNGKIQSQIKEITLPISRSKVTKSN